MKKQVTVLMLTIGAGLLANPIAGKFDQKVSELLTLSALCGEELESAVAAGARAGRASWLGDRRGMRYSVPFEKNGKTEFVLKAHALRGIGRQCQIETP